MSAGRALITGITGQDGSYLADLLIRKGYEVHGMVRGGAPGSRSKPLGPVRGEVVTHVGDLRDGDGLQALVDAVQPDELYNLAGMTSATESWKEPLTAGDLSGLGTARLLEALRSARPEARFFQASSSEVFGTPQEAPQLETTPIRPSNPYGAAKAYAQFMVSGYRKRHDIFACSGILFNHESPRRRHEFVSRKVTRAAAAIKLGMGSALDLGNLDARRDWGFAGDYVEAMWLMLQQDQPGDYVIATGETHTVRELVSVAFEHAGLDPDRYVRVDPALVRPREQIERVGDPGRARECLGWAPRVGFEQMVRQMVDADLEALGAAGPSDR